MGLELCGNLVDFQGFAPGAQPVKRYAIPPRADGFAFEYSDAAFVIAQDLRTCLDRDAIRRQVAVVVDRIGQQAQELLRGIRVQCAL